MLPVYGQPYMLPVYGQPYGAEQSRSVASACKLLFRAHDLQLRRRRCGAIASEVLASQAVLTDIQYVLRTFQTALWM